MSTTALSAPMAALALVLTCAAATPARAIPSNQHTTTGDVPRGSGAMFSTDAGLPARQQAEMVLMREPSTIDLLGPAFGGILAASYWRRRMERNRRLTPVPATWR